MLRMTGSASVLKITEALPLIRYIHTPQDRQLLSFFNIESLELGTFFAICRCRRLNEQRRVQTLFKESRNLCQKLDWPNDSSPTGSSAPVDTHFSPNVTRQLAILRCMKAFVADNEVGLIQWFVCSRNIR